MKESEFTVPNFVYIVDDDEGVRKSLRALLGGRPDTIAVAFDSGEAFLDRIDERESGVLVLDFHLPKLGGEQVLERLGDLSPRFPTIMLIRQGEVLAAVLAMKLGAFDCLEKPHKPYALIGAIEAAQTKLKLHVGIDEEGYEARRLLACLSERESEVLGMLVEGLQNKVVASRLGTSLRTAEAHRAKILAKLRAKSLSDALLVAFRAGMTGPDFIDRPGKRGVRTIAGPACAAGVPRGSLVPMF